MSDRTALTRLAKALVADMEAERLSGATQRSMSALDAEPEHVFYLVDLLAKEGRKKCPNDRLMNGYAFILAHSLEVLRYAVDRDDNATNALIARLRQHLIETGAPGRMPAPVLLLVLHQFTSAKLDIGDELRNLMQTLMENDDAARAACERGEGADHFTRMVEQFGGDTFAIHAYLDQSVEAMPVDGRAGLVMATFAEKDPAIREAAIGFLLNGSVEVRSKLTELIELAVPHGLVSPTMLRRMIAMRNWVPANERDGLDAAIRIARKKSIECAPSPRPVVQQILSSGIDGSGSLSILVLAKEDGKPLIAGLLVKHGFGVRDAWVRRNADPATLLQMVDHVDSEICLSETSLDYARIVCSQALAINIEAGQPPPFALVDFAEAAGLAELNPRALPADKLVAELISDVDAAKLSATAVKEALRRSADWLEEHPTLATWFEDNVTKGIGTGRTPRAKQVAFLVAGPLQARRHRWAELVAWTALSLKHRDPSGDWQGFVIVAKELLGQRPLEEIGLMKAIASNTIEVMGLKGLLGTRHAA